GEAPVGLHMTRAGQALARRLASHDAGRSPFGAPPWRFWAPGAALLSPNTRLRLRFGRGIPIGHSELLAPQAEGLAGGVPASQGAQLRVAAARRHSPLRLQDRLRRRPSMSEDANLVY